MKQDKKKRSTDCPLLLRVTVLPIPTPLRQRSKAQGHDPRRPHYYVGCSAAVRTATTTTSWGCNTVIKGYWPGGWLRPWRCRPVFVEVVSHSEGSTGCAEPLLLCSVCFSWRIGEDAFRRSESGRSWTQSTIRCKLFLRSAPRPSRESAPGAALETDVLRQARAMPQREFSRSRWWKCYKSTSHVIK